MTKFYLLICNKTNIGQDSMMKITHRLDTQNNTPIIMKDCANFCNLNYVAMFLNVCNEMRFQLTDYPRGK